MARFIVSNHWELIPLEKRKLLSSLGWGILALISLALASYLEQFGLPEQLKFLAPFIPVIVNFLNKWAGQHRYKE